MTIYCISSPLQLSIIIVKSACILFLVSRDIIIHPVEFLFNTLHHSACSFPITSHYIIYIYDSTCSFIFDDIIIS